MGKLSRRNVWLLYILLLSFGMVTCNDVEDSSSDISDYSDDDGIIEMNPQYAGVFENSDSIDHDTESEEVDGKAVIDRTMSKSQKGMSSSVRFVKKHRKEITFALILFAFRREICGCIRSLLTKTGPSGEKKIRRIPLSPTSILKIILFIDIMRKMQSNSYDGPPTSSPNPSFLSAFTRDGNSAYLPPVEQHYTFECLNDRYKRDRMAFQKAISGQHHTLPSFKSILGTKRKSHDSHGASERKMTSDANKFNGSTAIILDLTALDTSVSQIDVIRDEVSFLLHTHRANQEDAKSAVNITSSGEHNSAIPELEVIVLLESPGGSASDYGLGANQMMRLRDEPGITLTICVDKVAASGGYMMACVAHRLCCAHFAVVGSIGVIGQALNIHNILQNWGVRPLVFRGGKDKAPVGMIGEVTKEGIAKVQSMVDKTHFAFKRHVVGARPGMANHIEEVSTGDVYLGSDAIGVGLVDRLITSDEYIGEKVSEGVKVLKLMRNVRRSLHLWTPNRLSPFAQSASDLQRVLSKIAEMLEDFTGGTSRNGSSLGSTSLSALFADSETKRVTLSRNN
mmetsp:Transcript_49938/g.150192  ORF Transcript_49938/g.150192 Transcript_49938/m.150192 type:complete len:567 (-) Transcript_49938:31-1731(-)